MKRKQVTGPVKYKVTLEYDGTNYSGWQYQKNARSVQDALRTAAETFFKSAIDVQGAGRTDAGVHALGQVASLAAPRRFPAEKILHGINDLLPASVNLLRVEEVPWEFHPRHDAVGRVYLYVISTVRTAFGKRSVWWIKDRLDLRRMRASAALFQGFHDFASFADRRMDAKVSTMVQLDDVSVRECGDWIVIRVAGSHFLWKMVRRMVGILVEAGRGNVGEKDILAMLEGFSEAPARFTAPPSGLYLAQVLYKGDRPQDPVLPFAWAANR